MIRVNALALLATWIVFGLATGPAPVDAFDGNGRQLFWMFLGAPLGDPNITDLVVSPDDDNLWYVASDGNGLYITRDGGSSWEQHLAGTVGAIAFDPRSPNVVYAGSGSDLYWSVNSGETWLQGMSFPNPIPGSPQSSPTFIDSLLVSAIDGTIVVGLTSMFHSARVYVSQVVGGFLFWNVSWESPNGYHIWALAEDPASGNWFFSTEESQHVVDPVVMRSTDRGESWQEMIPLTGYLTDGHGLNLEFDPTTGRVFFLTESSMLYISDDSGDTWSAGHYVDFGSALLTDPNCPNRVYGGEMVRGVKVGGVYISETGGQSFQFEGPANNSIASLALNGASTTLLATAYGAGLWELQVGGNLTCSTDLPFFADGFESQDTRRWWDSVGGP